MCMNLRFAVSFIDLCITIQYAVFCESLSTFYVSLYIYIHITMKVNSQYTRSMLNTDKIECLIFCLMTVAFFKTYVQGAWL